PGAGEGAIGEAVAGGQVSLLAPGEADAGGLALWAGDLLDQLLEGPGAAALVGGGQFLPVGGISAGFGDLEHGLLYALGEPAALDLRGGEGGPELDGIDILTDIREIGLHLVALDQPFDSGLRIDAAGDQLAELGADIRGGVVVEDADAP